MAQYAVTCRVEGCENANITIILNDPGSRVVCGPCGTDIIDVDPPLPEEPEEIPEWL